MKHRALAILLAHLVGLPVGLSAAGSLVYHRLGRPPELPPIGHLGPFPFFSPVLTLHLLPLLPSTQLFSVFLQVVAATLAIPAGFAALAAAVTRGQLRDGSIAETAHGLARWASARDLRRAKLFASQGVVLGRTLGPGSRRIVDGSDHHILLVMPPGAGKTTGPILSTLATNRASSFVLDPKGELFETSAGWRATMGHRVIRFAPTLALSDGGRPTLEPPRRNRARAWGRRPGDRARPQPDQLPGHVHRGRPLDRRGALALLSPQPATLYASVPYNDLARRVGEVPRLPLRG